MRKRLFAVAFALTLFGASYPAYGDVISESKNFKLITSVTIGGISVGGQAVGDTYFVASWQTGLRSYDISDPENQWSSTTYARCRTTRTRTLRPTARSCSCRSSTAPTR